MLNRFYLTLMLYDLWNQRSVWDVADEYDVPRGFVQTLMTSSAAFSSCVLRFCEVRKYDIYSAVITKLNLLLSIIILSLLNSQACRCHCAYKINRSEKIARLQLWQLKISFVRDV